MFNEFFVGSLSVVCLVFWNPVLGFILTLHVIFILIPLIIFFHHHHPPPKILCVSRTFCCCSGLSLDYGFKCYLSSNVLLIFYKNANYISGGSYFLVLPNLTQILSTLFLSIGCFYVSSCYPLVYFQKYLFTSGHLSINYFCYYFVLSFPFPSWNLSLFGLQLYFLLYEAFSRFWISHLIILCLHMLI